MTSLALSQAAIKGEARAQRATLLWVAVALVGYALLPWHWTAGLDLFDWLGRVTTPGSGSGLYLALTGEWWLLPLLIPLALAARVLLPAQDRLTFSHWLVAAGALGLAWMTIEG